MRTRALYKPVTHDTDLSDGVVHEVPGVLVDNVTAANPTAFQDLILYCGAFGGIAIYCNELIEKAGTSAVALAFPFSIDWQLLRGLGGGPTREGCVWEPVPVATGTTNIADAAGLEREGLMFQVTGCIDTWWLLRARFASTPGAALKLSIAAQRCGGCVSGNFLRVDVGNFIG